MRRSTKITVGIVTVVLVGAVAGGAVWLLRPRVADPVASPTPQAPPSEAEVDELDGRLASGEPGSVASALGLPADEVSGDIVTGFQDLDIEWDRASISEVSSGAWTIPAAVAAPDGTTSTWSVTLVRSEEGLVFVDSVVLP